MVSVITFKFLRDLQKKERDASTLTPIPDDFYEAAKSYITRKQRLAMQDSMKSFTNLKEIENMRPVIKYIFNRREQKIMTCALRAARIDTLKIQNMIKEEQELFDTIKNKLKKRRSFLDAVLMMDNSKHNDESSKIDNDTKQKTATKEPKENTDEEQEEETQFIKIEVLEEITEFVAEDLESYGPWSPGEIVVSPQKVANIFIGAKKAKLVE